MPTPDLSRLPLLVRLAVWLGLLRPVPVPAPAPSAPRRRSRRPRH